MPWVIENREGQYREVGNYPTDDISRSEIFHYEEDADYFCQGSTGQPIEIIVMKKDEYDAIINMRNECSMCHEKLDTHITKTGVRRIEPCQRGCRG